MTVPDRLPAVVVSLSREARERGDALALGLNKVAKSYKIIATLYIMRDILHTISHLSLILQLATIDL